MQVAQWFELLFVNSFGLGYNMGVLIYAILLVAVFILKLLTNSSSNHWATCTNPGTRP